jgi:hypothetical protein
MLGGRAYISTLYSVTIGVSKALARYRADQILKNRPSVGCRLGIAGLTWSWLVQMTIRRASRYFVCAAEPLAIAIASWVSLRVRSRWAFVVQNLDGISVPVEASVTHVTRSSPVAVVFWVAANCGGCAAQPLANTRATIHSFRTAMT